VTIFAVVVAKQPPLQKLSQRFRNFSHKSCRNLKSELKVAENFSNFLKLKKLLCCQGFANFASPSKAWGKNLFDQFCFDNKSVLLIFEFNLITIIGSSFAASFLNE
jgi:hypothetical protein